MTEGLNGVENGWNGVVQGGAAVLPWLPAFAIRWRLVVLFVMLFAWCMGGAAVLHVAFIGKGGAKKNPPWHVPIGGFLLVGVSHA